MKFVFTAILLSCSIASAFTPTKAQIKSAKASVWTVMEIDGADPDLSPEILKFKILGEADGIMTLRFSWIEAFGKDRTCTYKFDHVRNDVIENTISCVPSYQVTERW